MQFSRRQCLGSRLPKALGCNDATHWRHCPAPGLGESWSFCDTAAYRSKTQTVSAAKWQNQDPTLFQSSSLNPNTRRTTVEEVGSTSISKMKCLQLVLENLSFYTCSALLAGCLRSLIEENKRNITFPLCRFVVLGGPSKDKINLISIL